MSTIRAIYCSVSFEKASNLHAGLCGAKRWKERWLRCSLFPSLPLDHGFAPINPEKTGKVLGRKALTKGN